MTSWLRIELLWLAAPLILVLGYLRYFEWQNVFHPTRVHEATPADEGMEYEDIEFLSDDGKRLHGWWIPCEDARGTLLFCHGNGGNISTRTMLIRGLHELRMNVFSFDYRGYGKSLGIPTEKGTYLDAEAAYEVVRVRYSDADDPPVVVYGRSLGGAVAVELARRKPVRGLIVDSSFTSTIDMGREMYPNLPVKLFCRYRYDSLSKVGRISVPKLIVHSPADEVIPYRHGMSLYEHAAEPKTFFEIRGAHDEIAWTSTPQFFSEMNSFIDQVLSASP